MKNILFNASTNIIGGGVKNSALFIKNAINNNDFNWYYAVSKEVNDFLIEWKIDTSVSNFRVFDVSPSKSSKAKKEILEMVSSNNMEMVYTMAGPAYVKFPCKHIQGISNAYITHADWENFKIKGNLLRIVRYYLYVLIQFLYVLRADHFIFQTDFAKESFKRRSGINEKRLNVITNAFDTAIRDYFSDNVTELTNNIQTQVIQIFCPGAAYIHKGFQFIPDIIKELTQISDKKFKFILTLPKDSKIWNQIEFQLKSSDIVDYCENIGPFKYTEIIPLLKRSDLVFVPSLLETFSASYLEAMCARKKLIVADKLFARDVCGEYAIYINPQDSINTAKVFNEAFDNLKLSDSEISLSNTILNKYGNQTERSEKLFNLIHKISQCK